MQQAQMHETAPDGASTLDELNTRWMGIVGLLPPGLSRIPDEVILRAGADERFARYLVESRENPSLLAMLFADPNNAAFRAEPDVRPPYDGVTPQPANGAGRLSTAELVANAAISLGKWAATAFERVDQAESDRRLIVCRACPHSESIESTSMLTRLTSSETAVCGLCGCPLGRKARMASGSCPDADPARPEFNRWGQPRGA